jgi:two-component system NtrC family sensor kinase
MAIAAELAIALENADLFEVIRAAEANYRDLFDNANDFILTLDNNFKISSANKMALKSTGYQLKEIIGVHVINFIKPQYQRVLYQLLKDRLGLPEAKTTFELPILAKNGDEIVLEITFRVRPDEHRSVTIHCIGRDITQRRELEQQLRQTEKLSAIGKLVAGVAHELNNPLTSIIGYSKILQKDDVPPAYREDLDIIFRQAERARIIVRNLLTFARRFDLETEPVDINDLLTNSLAALKPELQAHAVQVVTALDFSLPRTLADPHQLEQVFINLIGNAIHALAPIKGPRRLTIESKSLNDHIHLKFSDNGPGIPKNIINRIFDPFFSTKEVGEGTGLGLSICFGIISEHKGQIQAENNPESGATFSIALPLKAPTMLTPNDPVEIIPQTDPLTSLKILAVDDEYPLLKLLHRVLSQRGHTVEMAADGQTALQKLAASEYDLVICDMIMPDILGTDLYERAAKKYTALDRRFIFVSGNVVDKDTRLFLEKSRLPWLSKPFLPADIENIVHKTANATLFSTD